MSDRYPDATLALALLPPPAVVKTVDYEAIRAARLGDFAARYKAKTGLVYDVATLESDPGVILQEEGAVREEYNLTEINTAAKAVMQLFARGTDQDNLYSLLGIRRLVLKPADPAATPPAPAVMEDDDDFLARSQIALEGTAPGLTGGGYAHIALRVAPEAKRVALVRRPGGVVQVVLQGRSDGAGTVTTVAGPGNAVTLVWQADTATPHNDGSVSDAAVRAVAAALNDDWSEDPATGSQMTDVPMVQSAEPLAYDIVARAVVPKGPTLAGVAAQSLAGLAAAAALAQRIGAGNGVATDALIAAGRSRPMTKLYLDAPAQDVACTPQQCAFPRSITLTVTASG